MSQKAIFNDRFFRQKDSSGFQKRPCFWKQREKQTKFINREITLMLPKMILVLIQRLSKHLWNNQRTEMSQLCHLQFEHNQIF